MAMTIRNHAVFWAAAAAAFFGFVWILGDALLPFICGMTIAYLLGPIVRRLIQRGVPRKYAALLILGTFFLLMLIMLALIIPFAWRQASQLAVALPTLADRIQTDLGPYIQWIQQHFDTGDLTEYQNTLKENIGKVFQVSGTVLAGIIGGGRVALGIISFLFITPIVAFFMMEQWVAITHWIDDMIPRKNYDKIRDLLSQMNEKVSGFIRGQLIISFLLGISYAVVLTLAGLKFGFLIGLMTGVLSIIPLVGTTIGLITSVSVAWFQSYSFNYTGIIAAIFITGQFLEGNILTPKIMGNSVGLHPVWILFALLAGGALFGLTGMFLAVPVAAVIGVLCSFAVKEYKRSMYYDNHPEDQPLPVQVIVQVPPPQEDKPVIIHPDDPAP